MTKKTFNPLNFAVVCLVSMITVGLSGCKNPDDQTQPNPAQDGDEITFAPTFTSPAGTAAPYSEIGVFAFATGTKVWANVTESALPDLMYNYTLAFADGKWNYAPTQSWPEGKTSFFAYAPVASATNGVSISAAEATGAPVLTYDMGISGGHQDVLIGADKDRTGSKAAVNLPLRSVMTKIGFKLKGNGQKVSEIVMRGVIEQGTIALDAQNAETMTWVLGEPTDSEIKVGLAFDAGQKYVTATETVTNITADDGYLFLLPQNFGYDMRIVATVDGNRVGLPIESAFQIKPGEEQIITVNLSSDTYLDYTDNSSAAFFIDPTDVALAQNVSWADAAAACPDGYRLPTYNEGLALLTYFYGVSNNRYRIASYWCSTLLKGNTTQAMGYDPFRQMALYMTKAGITAGRCVITNTSDGKKYPYVDTSNPDGPIIVSRDADGGVNEQGWFPEYNTYFDVFHDNWTTTPAHDITTMADRISRKLQVANEDASTGKVRYSAMSCPAGWRTPTHIEIMMIYAMGGGPSSSYDTTSGSDYYNPPMTDTPLHSVAGFTPLLAEGYWVSSTLAASGGGRSPVWWPFTETPMRSVGNDTDPNSPFTEAKVRCVKDIE